MASRRRMLVPVLGVLAAVAAPLVAAAAPQSMTFGPPGAWVHPLAAPPARPLSGAAGAGDSDVRLIDHQVNRAIEPPETYSHVATQALNEQGLAEVSQVSCTFNPAYETLVWHEVVIRRGARVIRVPLAGQFKLLHRETALEDQIYDGSLTAVMPLEDVRPGDMVESSYTIRGANPALAGHFGTAWATVSGFPIARLHYRLLWPAARPLAMHRAPGTPAPTVTPRGDALEYELREDDVPAAELEPGTPAWVDPQRSVWLEDVRSWNEVARWARTLFPDGPAFSPALRAKVAELAQAAPTPEGRAMAAIRFVQDEVRYLGIEIGENAQRARDPNLVLKRRFGDCKDKAYLLVILLRALGYEADPALVQTALRDSVGRFGPSAVRFDHVIVRLRDRASGVATWVDATESGQRGSRLSDLVDPGLGAALVVSDTTRGLSPVRGAFEPALTTVEKRFTVADPESAATLEVRTGLFGRDANLLRAQLRSGGRDAVEKAYLGFYRREFPAIELASPLSVVDDEARNRLELAESYRIPRLWRPDAPEDLPRTDLGAVEAAGYVPSWRGTNRLRPLALGPPGKILYSSTIELPYRITPATARPVRLAVRGLRFLEREWNEGPRLVQHVELESAGGALTPAEAVAASPRFEAMALALSLGAKMGPVTAPAGAAGTGAAGATDVAQVALVLMGLVLGSVLAFLVALAPAPATLWPFTAYAPRSVEWNADQPIGGWLYLFGIGVVCAPFVNLITGTRLLVSPEYQNAFLARPGSPAHLLFLGILAAVAAAFVGSILLAVLFLQRRRKFFRFYVGYMACILAISLATAVLGILLAPTSDRATILLLDPLRTVFGFALWGTYFLRSRRAQATFIR